ncbi:MAG TPA: LysM peptidoglycan-binding domain-containing protein [Thermoflexia bacterium]|nr:LysM peptidoglycan-binding domain-containing protein [Thermoflexia bacterium]
MNTGALIPLGLILLAVAWGIWIIFKQNPSSVNLAKLFSYFAGVVLTLLAILWIVSRFVPWWGVRLMHNTSESGNVQKLETLSHELWTEVMNNTMAEPTTEIVTPEVPQATPTGGEEIVPTATPEIGAESPNISSQAATAESTYTVQSGDTLYSISRKYPGVSVAAIKTQNNLPDDIIKVGQQLVIPATP